LTFSPAAGSMLVEATIDNYGDNFEPDYTPKPHPAG
jgi:hypothetical protein